MASIARIDLLEEAAADPIVVGALLGYETPEHHKRWVDAYRKNQNLLVLSPANHGKTTLFGLLVPLQAMLRDRNVRIGYITANGPIAESVLRMVRQTLEAREFQKIFGDWRPKNPSRWTVSEIVIERRRALKDATIFCGGLWSAIINRRFDLLVCDDICDDENMKTLESRLKVKQRFYEVILPCLEPLGKVVVIGTRQHFDDVYSELLQNDLWVHIVEQAWSLREGQRETLWPERWGWEALERKRAEVGEVAFAKRYLNIVNPEGLAMFPEEWVKACQDESLPIFMERGELPEFLREALIVQAVDIAVSSSAQSANFAHVTCAVRGPVGGEQMPTITILNCCRAKMNYPTQKEFIIREAQAWQPSVILVESNGIQQLILQDLAERGQALPLVPSYTGRDKMSLDAGIPYLSSLVKGGHLKIPWKDAPTQRATYGLVEEMTSWPKGKSDDLLMALWFVVKHVRFARRVEIEENFHAVRPRMRYATRRLLPRRAYGNIA